jgi:hypothetical protein
MDDARVIDPEDPRWPEAERRDALLRRLLMASGWKLTPELVEAVHEELGIPRSTLFRLVGRFRRTKRATSLLPQSAGTPDGAKRIDARIEALIAEQIEGGYDGRRAHHRRSHGGLEARRGERGRVRLRRGWHYI